MRQRPCRWQGLERAAARAQRTLRSLERRTPAHALSTHWHARACLVHTFACLRMLCPHIGTPAHA
eukprot:248364-Chlamydomonas_euryale.AAC.1